MSLYIIPPNWTYTSSPRKVLRALDFVDPAGFRRWDAGLAKWQIIEDYQNIGDKKDPLTEDFYAAGEKP